MKYLLLISVATGVVVFAVKYWIDYKALLAQQPVNGVLPDVFTSTPPTAAWITALPWGIAVGIALLAVMYVCKKYLGI